MRAPPPDPSQLAKAWLVALIEDGTLDDAARIDTAAFARDAPAFCAALLSALTEDVPLPAPPADPALLRQVTRRALDARLSYLTTVAAAPPAAAPLIDDVLRGLTEPFVLLAAELTWRHGDCEAGAAALRAHLRPGDRLLDGGPGRWWLIAPGTEAATARQLAATIAEDGSIAFGLAACPHDGVDPEALVAHADEMLFSARAAGLPVA